MTETKWATMSRSASSCTQLIHHQIEWNDIYQSNRSIPNCFTKRRNQYVMLLYTYDSNAILAEGCKTRIGIELTATYDILSKILTKTGIVPVIQRIDNEISKILIELIEEMKLAYQLASPHDH